MPSSKMARVEEQPQNDLISQLPVSILVEILSRLPTLDAVKMASFSRFRNLWTGIRCLSFDESAFHKHDTNDNDGDGDGDGDDTPNYDERFLNLIRSVLILHERPTIDEFHLKFDFDLFYVNSHNDCDYSSKVKRMASELFVWIQFALRKQVKVLDIDLLKCGFSRNPKVNYELPSSVLTNKYLMELSLAGCGIKGKGHIQLLSLTKLSLTEIKVSDEIMGEIFQGCPMIEEVSLHECCGFSKLNMTNHNIKRLKIFFTNQSVLEISCLNIKSLELCGSIKLAHLKVPCKVSRASINFNDDFTGECSAYETIMMLLQTLANANTFISYTSTTLVFTIFTKWALLGRGQIQHHWKSIEFRLIFSKWHLPGIWSILTSSTSLETLTFYIGPVWHNTHTTTDEEGIENEIYDFEGKDYLKWHDGDFPWLKTVSIYGYVIDPYVFKLIEFLLKSAPLLERMVVSTKKTINNCHQVEPFEHSIDNNKLLQFSQKLSSLPRASNSTVIQFCY